MLQEHDACIIWWLLYCFCEFSKNHNPKRKSAMPTT